jgi:NADH:ubiquinone oxidoreductase subunit F (NADH-binding)
MTRCRPVRLLDDPLTGPVSLLAGEQVGFPDRHAAPRTALTGHDLARHAGSYGYRPDRQQEAAGRLLDDLERTGLTGRGGGHFPVSAKVRSAQRAGPGGVLVANGCESEPASAKDRTLLWLRPHLVLDGLAALAELVEAAEAVVWLHEGNPGLQAVLGQALAERRDLGLDRVVPRLELAPDRYLSGESGAIVRALSGGPALPAFRRVPASSSGVHGRPTLVHNVETLARVALTERFATPPSAGMLFTVPAAGQLWVVESDGELAVDQLIASVTGTADGYQAVLVGGYGGRWVDWRSLVGVAASQPELAAHGVSCGAGVLLPVRADECGLWQVARIADYLAAGSARQCGPCMFGLPAVATLLDGLVRDANRRELRRLHGYLAEIAGRGACRHPDGALGMIASGLEVFADDLVEHLAVGDCGRRRVRLPGLA